MTTLNEGQHTGEFVVSVVDAGEGSTLCFESGTLKSGDSVVDGQPVILESGEIRPAVGSVDTAGDSDEAIVGLAYGAFDATGGAIPITYVARLAEVNEDLLHYPTTSDQATTNAAITAALKALFIILR